MKRRFLMQTPLATAPPAIAPGISSGITPGQWDAFNRSQIDALIAGLGKGTDIVASYGWLQQNYVGLKGTQTLVVVKQSAHYGAFVTKVRYLYEAIGDTFDHDTSYPWLTYLFVGMTEAQVRKRRPRPSPGS